MMFRKMPQLMLAALVACALVAQPAAAAKRPTYAQLRSQIRTLTHSRSVWRQRAQTALSQRDAARDQRDRLQGSVNSMTGQITTLQGQVNSRDSTIGTLQTANAALVGENNGLKAGLPTAIRTVAEHSASAAEVYNTILAPARAGWACGGSTFLGQTFISVDFNQIGFC